MFRFLKWVKHLSPLPLPSFHLDLSHPRKINKYLVVDASEVFGQVAKAVSYRSRVKGHRLVFRRL